MGVRHTALAARNEFVVSLEGGEGRGGEEGGREVGEGGEGGMNVIHVLMGHNI